jgi:hypothetical protein
MMKTNYNIYMVTTTFMFILSLPLNMSYVIQRIVWLVVISLTPTLLTANITVFSHYVACALPLLLVNSMVCLLWLVALLLPTLKLSLLAGNLLTIVRALYGRYTSGAR